MAGITLGKYATNLGRLNIYSRFASMNFASYYSVAGVAVVALFGLPLSIIRKKLTIRTLGAGQTNPAPGEYKYRVFRRVQLKAMPSPGWTLEGWEIDGKKSFGNDCSVLVLKSHEIQAVFKREREPLKNERVLRMLPPEGSGRVIPDVGDHQFPKDHILLIKAIPETGKRFKCWYIDTSRVFENRLQIKMNKDKMIQAVFVQDRFTEKERIEIQDLIAETVKTIANSALEAKKSQNVANLKGLDTLQRMVDVLYQRIEDGQVSFSDAKAELSSFRRYAEGLGRTLPTYYDLLKVSPSATENEIRIAFNEMIKQYHPDKFPNLPEWLKQYCDEMTRKLIEARDTLLDESRRKKYDESIGV